jgi:uncharacterized protein YjbI with pentapeptide repeats
MANTEANSDLPKRKDNRLAWTGLFPYTSPDGKTERGKTLWDWMGLLLVPVLLAVGGFWLNDQASQRQQVAQLDTARETALQDYLDRMGDLLLINNLAHANPNGAPADIAQTLTSTVLTRLDIVRKVTVIRFLYNAKLIRGSSIIISLNKANLSGVDLSTTDLPEANLSGAILTGANLSGRDLEKITLNNADLTNANLRGVDLTDAYLISTTLTGADMTMASLIRVNLTGAIVTNEQLATVAILTGSTLPDGTKR